MEREPCDSSTITSIGYDAQARMLEVEFRSGGIYQYYDVPPHIHAELVQAESCGKYLQGNVKGQYRYARV
jgi:hypothetical protein